MRQYSSEQGGKSGTGRTGYGRPGGGSHRDNREGHRGGNRGDFRREGQDRGGYRRSPESHHRAPVSHRSEEKGEGGKFRPMSWVEVAGRTKEEATEEAARRFNVPAHDLKVEVLEEGSKGFLGIGSKPARVKVALKPNALPLFAEGTLSRILRGMGFPDKVRVKKDSDGNPVLNIEGPSSASLIGRHGSTLESMQYLVSKIVQRVVGDDRMSVVADAENYLDRQKDKLRDLALSLAQKAHQTGVEVPMHPMSSKDRRVVHLALKDHAHVTTESRGEGLRRKVVIVPKVKASSPEAAPAGPEASAPSVSEVAPVAPSAAPPVPTGETGPVASPPEPGNAAPKVSEQPDDIGNRA